MNIGSEGHFCHITGQTTDSPGPHDFVSNDTMESRLTSFRNDVKHARVEHPRSVDLSLHPFCQFSPSFVVGWRLDAP